jgi:DNA-binding protein H-NS
MFHADKGYSFGHNASPNGTQLSRRCQTGLALFSREFLLLNEYPMTQTYAQLVKKMEALQALADKARGKEAKGVIGRIREAIAAYGLTAEDLGFTAKAKPGRKPGAAKKTVAPRKAGKTARAIKYRNDAGDGWVGRGKRPQWLRDALANGAKLEDFAVK